MGVRSSDLTLELWVTLREAFRHDVIHKTIAIHQGVSSLVTPKARGGVSLVVRHRSNQKIHFVLAQRVGSPEECIRGQGGSFDAAYDLVRWSVPVPRCGWRWGGDVASDLDGVLNESRGELRHREVERECVQGATRAAVSFHEATELRSPLSSEIADTEIESFVLGVVATSDSLTSHKILQAAQVGTEEFCTTLSRNLVDGVQSCLQTWVVESEQGVDRIVPCIGRATLDCTVFPATGWKYRFLRKDTVKKRRHEGILSADGCREHQPPTAVDVILFDRFIWRAP